MPAPERVIVWFRRDLRSADHTALARACASARQVVPVFIFDTDILDRCEDRDDRRVSFIRRSLRELDDAFAKRGSGVLVRHGRARDIVPQLAIALGAGAVFANRDHEPAAILRDAAVAAALTTSGREFLVFHDLTIFEQSDIRTGSGQPYRIFTPYRNAWLGKLAAAEREGIAPLREERADLRRLHPRAEILAMSDEWTPDALGFDDAPLWLEPGERAAHARLRAFLRNIDTYHEDRDFPAKDGTSGLSAHVRFGTISIRALAREAVPRPSAGAKTWLSELIWRDFYQMILDSFPHVATGAFRREYASIAWPGSEAHFHAWAVGHTGYPLIDAAMRHFNATGWMHNRLRMVVAMFLVKDLLVDWRKGEAHFARLLLDYDLAANNGGWQWCASTGSDAQPYFRVFNPVLQSRRFDPGGVFIRRHCPELRGFSDARIHWPHDAGIAEQRAAGCILGAEYPRPLVDHAEQRARAEELFKAAGVRRSD